MFGIYYEQTDRAYAEQVQRNEEKGFERPTTFFQHVPMTSFYSQFGASAEAKAAYAMAREWAWADEGILPRRVLFYHLLLFIRITKICVL